MGNVLAVCSDRKIVVASDTNALLFDYYLADLWSVSDYHPFGMLIPERSRSAGSYRFGFNGKERDADWQTDSYDFGARMYDGRSGRWLSVDPKAGAMPAWSPYNFALNNPNAIKDSDGELPHIVVGAIVGGIVGGVINGTAAAIQGKSFKEVMKETGRGVVIGSVSGAVGAATGGISLAATLGSGALAGASEYAADRLIFGGEFKLQELAMSAGLGSFTAGVGRHVAKQFRKLKGEISVGTVTRDFVTPDEFATLPSDGLIDLSRIRFSQNNIKGTFKNADDGSVDDLIKNLESGNISADDIPAIRLVEKDGKVFSLDNRRLFAFQQAGVEVKYKKTTLEKEFRSPKEIARRFSTDNEGTSIEIRNKGN